MKDSLIYDIRQLSCWMERLDRTQVHTGAYRLSGVQRGVLDYLFARQGEDVYAVDLHAALGVSRSSISAALKGLERRGYLVVLKNPMDDRKKQLVLSDAACRLQAQLEQEQQRRQQELCRGLAPQQLEQMQQGLEIMLSNLRDAYQKQQEEQDHA